MIKSVATFVLILPILFLSSCITTKKHKILLNESYVKGYETAGDECLTANQYQFQKLQDEKKELQRLLNIEKAMKSPPEGYQPTGNEKWQK